MNATFESAGALTHPNLFAGDFPRVEDKLTVADGAGNLTAGAVLALDGSGNGVLVDSGNATPSIQSPHAILAQDIDASTTGGEVIVYLAGHFNESELTFGGTDTVADHRAALRQLGIYLGTNVGA